MEALGVCQGDLASIEAELSEKFKAKASEQATPHMMYILLLGLKPHAADGCTYKLYVPMLKAQVVVHICSELKPNLEHSYLYHTGTLARHSIVV